jgi:hypothetical protein
MNIETRYERGLAKLREIDGDRQRGHVLAALDLTHVGTLDAGQIRQ